MTQIYIAGFSSRQKAGQYLDVVSTGRYLLLPYPCANLYHDGQETPSTNSRACASKATPDNARAAPPCPVPFHQRDQFRGTDYRRHRGSDA